MRSHMRSHVDLIYNLIWDHISYFHAGSYYIGGSDSDRDIEKLGFAPEVGITLVSSNSNFTKNFLCTPSPKLDFKIITDG